MKNNNAISMGVTGCYMKLAVKVVIWCLGTIIFIACQGGHRNTRPNIILINVDDLGWKDVGFMGSRYYETPNMDALARSGMIFTNGYSSASNCAPSRACLITGQWTPRHGIYTVGSSERGDSSLRKLVPIKNTTILSRDFITLPEILQESGYRTCHAGKWHLSPDPRDYGFDLNIGGAHNGHPSSYYPPYRNVHLDAGGNGHLTDEIMENILGFIRSSDRPFFLHYAPYAVHTPIQAVNRFEEKYAEKFSSDGQGNVAYATMISNLDYNIGRLVSIIKNLGLEENTILILTSDNGGLYGITTQLPLRAGKGSYYEGGIRVPFACTWKGTIHSNKVSHDPVTQLDIFPTILDIAGLDKTKYQFDGISLLPSLKNNEQLAMRPLFWHFPIYLQAYDISNNQDRDPLFRTRPGSVVRLGEWKLHEYYEDNGLELYNLSEDISEKMNLAVYNPEKANELLQILNDWKQETKAPVPTELNPFFGGFQAPSSQ